MSMNDAVTVIGGGLAGCEAAWQLARAGLPVTILESKPALLSPAHSTPLLAEIVCSNSLRSDAPDAPAGLLKAELRRAGSIIIACAEATRVPAGDALAVDRVAFSRLVTARLANHPNIRIQRRVVDELPEGPAILATGPLTGGRLARVLADLCGKPLYFYDALAPIVDADTIDTTIAFRASRQRPVRNGAGNGAPVEAGAQEGDYLNCPLDRRRVPRLRRGGARRTQGVAPLLRGGQVLRGLPAHRGDGRARDGRPGLRPHAPDRPHRSAHRPPSPRGGAAAGREPPPHRLQPGRLPDPAGLPRAAAHLPR